MAFARHDSDPPLCSAHSGLLGAPRGNSNAVTHGYYSRNQPPDETESLFGRAGDVSLKQEAALIRVVLHRSIRYIMDNDLPAEKLISIAPLIFTGTRALAYIQRQVNEAGDGFDWDKALGEVAEELGVDL
jgi:hypothetical protein